MDVVEREIAEGRDADVWIDERTCAVVWTLADIARPPGQNELYDLVGFNAFLPASYITLTRLSQKYDQIWVLIDQSGGIGGNNVTLITSTAMTQVAALRGVSRSLETATGTVNVRTVWVGGGIDAARTIR